MAATNPLSSTINPLDINRTLEGLKSKALTLQSSLQNFSNQGVTPTVPMPSASVSPAGLDTSAVNKSLTDAFSQMNTGTDTILGKFATQKALTEQASTASAANIKSQSEQDIAQAQTEGQNVITAEMESRRGFATNTAVLSNLETTAKKRLSDLGKQRDQLLLQNDYNKATALNDLMVKEQETVTAARQAYFTNALSLTGELRAQSAEARAQASFQTPEQKNVDALKMQYADVPGVQSATNMADALKAVGPRLTEDRKYELAKQDADLQLQKAQTALVQANTQKVNSDINSGILDAADIQKIDLSPQGKGLNGLRDTKAAAQHYLDLLGQYGYQWGGVGKTLLEGAYADLLVKWKQTAGLGVLSQSDYDLISKAIAPATGVGGLSAVTFGGGTAGIKSQIQAMIDAFNKSGQDQYQQLLKRDPRYKNSEYVQGLGDYFKEDKTLGESVKPSLTLTQDFDTGVSSTNMFYNVLNK